MKTLLTAAALLLTASAAMAEAPCENPTAQICQKACAVMGAKYMLSVREQQLPARVRSVRAGDPLDQTGSFENAERLARFAGLSLDYIDGLPVEQISRAVATYCPR